MMDCKIYLGSICIMLEDLGFEPRKPDREQFVSMTYYYYAKFLYEKIFADIDNNWVLEMCLVPNELHIDRWKKNKTGLFMMQEETCIDLYHPKSIGKASDFVVETIKVARGY